MYMPLKDGGIRVRIVGGIGPCMQVAPGTLRIFQPEFFFVRDRGEECRRDDGRGVGWVAAGAELALGRPGQLFAAVILCGLRPSTQAFPPQAPAPVSLPSAELPAVR